ncbi:hypothetical protein [Bartonella sp. CB169]|uniref:hypothetical protein n=1 Tax=Bartonella sp. CB169 TaxID=3112257 RepID=UPI00300E4B87
MSLTLSVLILHSFSMADRIRYRGIGCVARKSKEAFLASEILRKTLSASIGKSMGMKTDNILPYLSISGAI